MLRPNFSLNVLMVLAASLAAIGCASKPETELYGDAAPAAAAVRTMHITPATKYVNVTGGETIRFVVDGQEFAWTFNTPPTVNHFELNKVAPRTLLNHRVTAYISPDPYYHLP